VPSTALNLTANELLRDATIRHAVLVQRFSAGEVKRIVKVLEESIIPDLVGLMTRRLDRISSRGFDRGPFSTKRYQEMIQAVNALLGSGYDVMGKDLLSSMIDFSNAEAKFALGMIDDALPIAFQFNSPGLSTLRNVVTKKIMGDVGVDMRGALRGVKTAGKKAVRAQIDIGLVQGETTSQIVRRIRGQNGVEHLLRRQVEAVVRTSVKHTSTATREATFAGNEDVTKGVQFVCVLDSRTSDICASLDGEVFGLREGPRPPMHHQCRSDIIPVLKSWRELGINLREAPEGTRASLNGQVPERVTYGPWLKTQSKQFQDMALGPGKADLFRRGVVPIQRFTDSQNRPLSLTQLLKLEEQLSAA